MKEYVFIESKDNFEAKDVSYYYTLATELTRHGSTVTLFLIQNAVLAARAKSTFPELSSLKEAGVHILADDFSLKERGIDNLHEGIKPTSLSFILDKLAGGCNIIWH